MPFVILPTNSASGGYDITNSARFNSGSSDNLTRTLGTATSRRIFTISTWVKRSNLDTVQNVFTAGTGSGDAGIRFNSGNELLFYEISSPYSAYNFEVSTSQLFRDVSAWYHILVAVDTTQATSSNRIKIYVNGSQVTAFGTASYPSQNYDGFINNNISHRISGAVDTTFGTRYFNGYIAETYFIDGQQLTPSSFGETDFDTGIWKPKAYTGTYGTNGFYLQFKNSASLGTDSSGNGNTFTVNNLTSIDQTTDTPTNNFCTLNPNHRGIIGTSATISEGNLKYASSSNGTSNNSMACSIGFSQGKWYWETKRTNSSIYAVAGIFNTANDIKGDSSNYIFNQTGFYGISDSGKKSVNGSVTSSFFTAGSQNDIFMYAYDMDNLKFYIGVNGTWLNSGVPTSGATGTGSFGDIASGTYTPAVCTENYLTAIVLEMNFGNPITSANSYTDGAGNGNFSYSVPSGFFSLNTKNLAQYG